MEGSVVNLKTCGRADLYIRKFDLADIGATLAAGPGPDSVFGHARHHARDRSPCQMSSNHRCRSPRPEREEHVKRTRISYDGLGGQEPNMSPSACFLSTTAPHGQTMSSLDKKIETGAVPQPSLLGKLCGKMARLLFGL